MFSDITSPDSQRVKSKDKLIGVLKGEGIGPEVIKASIQCLDAVSRVTGTSFVLEYGGEIGKASEKKYGQCLTTEVSDFCAKIFARGGAIFAGAGGSRFVYELRKSHGLYCKLSPLQPSRHLINAGCLKTDKIENVDIMIVRENISGVYQGDWSLSGVRGQRCSKHRFQYAEHEVRDILHVASTIAGLRTGKLSVIWKESGLPSISGLWKSCAQEICDKNNVEWQMLDVDYAAYKIIMDASDIDVLVAPNLFGDILSDLGAILLGSRGLSYSGNFSKSGAAVYQTNHGAAYDLADTDRSNPLGQINSLCMMLLESFDLVVEAELIKRALEETLRQGYRTPDIFEDGCRLVGTQEMGGQIAQQIESMAENVLQTHTVTIANRYSA